MTSQEIIVVKGNTPQGYNFYKMDKENISPEDMVVEFYTQVVSYYKLTQYKNLHV